MKTSIIMLPKKAINSEQISAIKRIWENGRNLSKLEKEDKLTTLWKNNGVKETVSIIFQLQTMDHCQTTTETIILKISQILPRLLGNRVNNNQTSHQMKIYHFLFKIKKWWSRVFQRRETSKMLYLKACKASNQLKKLMKPSKFSLHLLGKIW